MTTAQQQLDRLLIAVSTQHAMVLCALASFHTGVAAAPAAVALFNLRPVYLILNLYTPLQLH